MSFQDRTAEFQACVSATKYRSRTVGRIATPNDNNAAAIKHQKSDFTRIAQKIASEINTTGQKLQRLSRLAKRKTLFDDRPIEIQELTYLIKQSLSSLNADIASLQQIVRQNAKDGRNQAAQIDQHNESVVVSLQNSLADTSMNFRDILEVRSQNMKASQSRTEKFVASSSVTANSDANTGNFMNAYNANGASAAMNNGSHGDYLSLNIGDSANTRYEQVALLENQVDAYSQQRLSSIESIESTITELGGIFSQLAQMVSEQRESVQRIDANTEDIVGNIGGAQREIMKFYARVTSNRRLMLKIFGICILFFLIWVLVT
ncbi:SNARE Sed5 [Schizosaccharomyces japonicus yFS275]|uniref:SNARE Sed5 n=1 Tax=Schizosaccharomyces japonicus (strain yFS275 / FY16936) TaxID=402676 RepID=B6K4J1_SCHJY|nr:SNARE Sed5 [Schizosaccharomyces japonicus yFS275]EEB08398.1 SNARE Sed5 [Schizosaccharomyces japonicus yFS275]